MGKTITGKLLKFNDGTVINLDKTGLPEDYTCVLYLRPGQDPIESNIKPQGKGYIIRTPQQHSEGEHIVAFPANKTYTDTYKA